MTREFSAALAGARRVSTRVLARLHTSWLLAPLIAKASIVLCANLDRSRLDARIAAEGVTRVR